MPTKMGSSKIWNKLLDTFYSQVIINFEHSDLLWTVFQLNSSNYYIGNSCHFSDKAFCIGRLKYFYRPDTRPHLKSFYSNRLFPNDNTNSIETYITFISVNNEINIYNIFYHRRNWSRTLLLKAIWVEYWNRVRGKSKTFNLIT